MNRVFKNTAWAGLLVGAVATAALMAGCSSANDAEPVAAPVAAQLEPVNVTYYYLPG